MDGFYLKSDEYKLVKYVKNVGELSSALEKCPIGCIKFHLRDGKNDFAEWVKNSLKDLELSKRVGEIKLDVRDPEKTRKDVINALGGAPKIEQEKSKITRRHRKHSII